MRYTILVAISVLLFSCGGGNKPAPVATNSAETPNSKVDGGNTDKATATGDRELYQPSVDSIGALPDPIARYIPKDYLPLDTAIGDLNLDGTADVLLVVRSKWEDTIGYPAPEDLELKRPIMILLGQPDGSYTLAAKNDDAVMCINCSGIARSDPFTGLKIKNGYFSIEHGVAEGPQHWDAVTTFKYDKDKKEWYLHRDGGESYSLNPSDDPDADPMVKDGGSMRTKKDFGIVPFEKYRLDQ